MRAFTIPARGMTTPPTPSRPRPCTTATSPPCWPTAAPNTRSTTRPPAPARVNGRYTQSPFPGNKIPSNRFDKVGVVHPRLLSHYGKDAGRPAWPAELPGRHHGGKGQVLQRHLPRGPEPGRPAALLRPLQLLHPQQHLQPVLRQPLRRRPVLLLFEDRGLRPCHHAFAHDGAELALQLQPVHPRLRPAGRRSRITTWLRWASRSSTSTRSRRTRCAFPRINSAPATSATDTPTRTGP